MIFRIELGEVIILAHNSQNPAICTAGGHVGRKVLKTIANNTEMSPRLIPGDDIKQVLSGAFLQTSTPPYSALGSIQPKGHEQIEKERRNGSLNLVNTY